jgi:inner membrane protein
MDNLTHSLFALTLARTPLGRAGEGSTMVLLLASNAPDADVLTSFAGTLSYLHWHRGPTHGPLGVLGLGLASASLVWLAFRWLRRKPGGRRASFGTLVLLGVAGVLGHVLMDVPTSYGTRLFSPFSWAWFTTDWMPIVDVYLLVILAAGLAFGAFATNRAAGLAGSRAAPAHLRSRMAAVALVLMLAHYGLRAGAHHAAVAAAPAAFSPLLPEPCSAATRSSPIERWPSPPPRAAVSGGTAPCLVQVAAIPTFMSPFVWRLIAQMSNGYEMRELDLLNGRSGHATYPNRWTHAVRKAAESPVARTFLGFARFPAVRSVPDAEGNIVVQWTDLRFIRSGEGQGSKWERGFFTATVRVDTAGRVLEEGLGE